jgi:hypothetical protein
METPAGSMVEVSFGIRIEQPHDDAWDTAIEIQRVGKKRRDERTVSQSIQLLHQHEFTLDIEGVITVVRPAFVSFSEFVGNSGVNF